MLLVSWYARHNQCIQLPKEVPASDLVHTRGQKDKRREDGRGWVGGGGWKGVDGVGVRIKLDEAYLGLAMVPMCASLGLLGAITKER